jgi:PAS domain S-box-containing protein
MSDAIVDVSRRRSDLPKPAWTEEDRLKAIDSYGILDTPREQDYDDIATLAAQICNAPIALVNIVGEGRQWFKAEVGLGIRETPLEVAICKYAILQPGLFVVSDTTKDPRFKDNPLVSGEPHLRFYAGAVLENPEGFPLGTLCVLDYKPRTLTDHQAFALKALNRQVMIQLEMRRAIKEKSIREERLLVSELSYRRLFEAARDGVLILDVETGRITDVNPFLLETLGFERSEMIGKTVGELSPFIDAKANQVMLEELQQRGYVRYEDLPMETKDGRKIAMEFVSNVYQAGDKKVIQCNIRDITERKRAEERLNLLNTCISNFNDIVLITDADPVEGGRKIVFVNEAFERITGYKSAEALGKNPRFLQGEKTDRNVLAEIHQALEQQRPIRRQIVNYRKNGTEYWIDIDIIPIFDPAGVCTHFVAIQRDSTGEKKNREQLLWRTALFEAHVNSARDGILIVDSQGKKILQNQRLLDLLNIPPQIAEANDDRQELEWIVGQVKNPTRFAEKVAYLYSHPDEISLDEIELINGKSFERYSAPVRGKDGQGYGRIWSFRDITDRKKAEEQIAEQAALLDEARDAILVRSLDGTILFWNKGAERMYGWTREEAIGRNSGALLYPNADKFDEVNALTVTEGEWNGEMLHRARDRHEITVEARWTLIRDHDGRPKSVLAIYTDITERKKIEAQFMRAQRMESIGTLAGGIAHDLNNILAPIMMSIDILKTGTDPAQTKRTLETIEISARRGAEIVQQVLSFARGLEGARVEVQTKRILQDLESIIHDTFPKNIQLQFSLPPDTWAIWGDPTQIHQILLNLCVNARDAMPEGGKLSIDVENCVLDTQYAAMNLEAKAGHYVILSVTDTGTGVPAGLLEKIFEPFFTTKELSKGTGLGLSSVMAIVKSHEGIINVYSEPGKGTTFKVCLPAVDEISSHPDPKHLEETRPRGHGETVLVVDDESSILTITQQTLEAFGYRVLTAMDGADAVAVYAQHKNEIAVVLTDMMMPIMDGAAMIHALTRINPAIKIIATSGLNRQGGSRVLALPLQHFLTKPYTAEALLKMLRQILDAS